MYFYTRLILSVDPPILKKSLVDENLYLFIQIKRGVEFCHGERNLNIIFSLPIMLYGDIHLIPLMQMDFYYTISVIQNEDQFLLSITKSKIEGQLPFMLDSKLCYVVLSIVYFQSGLLGVLFNVPETSRGSRAKACDCKRDKLWVRFPVVKIKY